MNFRSLKRAALGTLVGLFAYDCLTPEKIMIRNLNTIKCGLVILYNYKIRFNADNFNEVHQDTARTIYETCLYNDGLYVKFGQAIAASDHVLPPPFFKWMSKLQDKAKQVPYEVIKKVFESEEGRTIQECFKQFDPIPVASASIAQVHKAKLFDGRQVAVKIQKPNIRRQFDYDMMMHTLILWVLQKAFDLPMVQFAEPVQRNLRKEVDFRLEAENTKIADRGFKSLKKQNVCVPNICDEFTRPRVLVTEWINGIKITDEKLMSQYGYNKDAIVQEIVRAFAQQIFITGFVHCDPHPGNLFVRPNPKNKAKPQLVILDHGLCIPVRQQFRKQYAQFWKAMFLQDINKMRQICAKWGIVYKQNFASAQMLRPYKQNKNIFQKISNKDVMQMQMKMKQDVKQIMGSSKQFPQQLLFLSRNMNLIRSINKYYGSKIDRISIMMDSAVKGSQISNSRKPNETDSNTWWQYINFKARVFVMKIVNWYMNFNGSSIDDLIDDASQSQLNKRMAEYGFKITDKNTFDA